MDLTIVISWLLYRRCGAAASGANKLMGLHDFKACVAEGLCTEGKEMSARNGKKSGLAVTVCFHKKPQQPRDPDQQQNMSPFMTYAFTKWTTDRQRCKMAFSTGISRVACSKCHVHMCCNPKKNCFHKYHIH